MTDPRDERIVTLDTAGRCRVFDITLPHKEGVSPMINGMEVIRK